MNVLIILLLMWAVTYPMRLLGLSLGNVKLPTFWLNFLKFVPVSVFAALVVPDVLGSGEWAWRVPAAVIAALLIWRTKNLGVGIVGGFAAYWLARAVGL